MASFVAVLITLHAGGRAKAIITRPMRIGPVFIRIMATGHAGGRAEAVIAAATLAIMTGAAMACTIVLAAVRLT